MSAETVRVPAGAFLRGSTEDFGLPDEHPQRLIELAEFHIDRVPVTWGDFEAFIQHGGYRRPELWSAEGWRLCEQENLTRPRFHGEAEWKHVTSVTQPVSGVSFWEAEAYARFVEKRLPTEAEWEKAARGMEGLIYPWGNTWDDVCCSFRGGTARAAPPVGRFPAGASPFGALDMSGGVWEWCSDFYDPLYYAVAPRVDPRGPAHGDRRVARGGAWSAMPLQNRTANRNAWRPSARFSNLGFRCAR